MMQNLNDIPGKNPFKVPDDYFEEVNRKIISVTSGFDQGVKKISIYDRFRTSLLIAASVAGFIIISYSVVTILTHDEINSQVSEVLNEVNPDSYINDLDMSSLEENVSTIVFSEDGSGVSRTDIIDYLLLENIEINEIFEQL